MRTYVLLNPSTNVVQFASSTSLPVDETVGWLDITDHLESQDGGSSYLNRKAISLDPLAFDMTAHYDHETGDLLVMPYVLTVLEFQRRFTREERIAVRIAAKTDAVVEDLVRLMDAATAIDVDDSDIVAGLNYLVTLGILTVERVAQIRMRV